MSRTRNLSLNSSRHITYWDADKWASQGRRLAKRGSYPRKLANRGLVVRQATSEDRSRLAAAREKRASKT